MATRTNLSVKRRPRQLPEIVGRTDDGVAILKPATRPTHFKVGEVRKLFEKLLMEQKPTTAAE